MSGGKMNDRAATDPEMGERVVRGLPGRLPAGETLIWQGSPTFRSVALHVFRVRLAAAYFGVLVAWLALSSQWQGEAIAATARSCGLALAASLAALAVLAAVSWLTARATIYTITDRRVVLQIGMALPMSVNIPFTIIESAALKIHRDGAGDIPLALRDGNKLAYIVLWPHARPWRFTRTEPTLRAVSDAAGVADLLARALADAAGQREPRAIASPVRRPQPAIVAGANIASAA